MLPAPREGGWGSDRSGGGPGGSGRELTFHGGFDGGRGGSEGRGGVFSADSLVHFITTVA